VLHAKHILNYSMYLFTSPLGPPNFGSKKSETVAERVDIGGYF